MKRSMLAATAAILLSGASVPALAADMFGGSTKDEPPFSKVETVRWSGIYLGAQGGYGNANHEVNVDISGGGKTFNLLDLDGINSRGFVGGVTGGADLARGRFLFGVLGGYSFNNIESQASIFNGGASAKLEKGDEWYVGGRAGVLVNPKTLLYIGAAYVHTDYTASASIGSTPVGSLSQDYDGLKGLAGAEFVIGGGFFGKVEYQHDFYGDVTWFNKGGLKVTDSADEDKILGGIIYKIGGGAIGLE